MTDLEEMWGIASYTIKMIKLKHLSQQLYDSDDVFEIATGFLRVMKQDALKTYPAIELIIEHGFEILQSMVLQLLGI